MVGGDSRRGGIPTSVALIIVAVALVGVAVAILMASRGGESPVASEPTAQGSMKSASLANPPAEGTSLGAEAAVETLRKYEAAYSRQSTSSLGALFTADVHREGAGLESGCNVSIGRPDVLADYQAQFSEGTGTYRLNPLGAAVVEIPTDGITAVVRTNYQISPGGSGPIRFELVDTGTLWRINKIVTLPCL